MRISQKMIFVDVRCDYGYATSNAVCVRIEGIEHWIPLSNLSYASANSVEAGEFERGEEIDLKVAKWFAEKEGFL